MPFDTGNNSTFKLDNSGGSLTAITAYITSCSLDRSADTADVTVMGSTAKSYLPTLTDATISIDAMVDVGLTGLAIFEASLGFQRSFEYCPNGSTSGYRKYTGECVGTKLTIDSPVDDKVGISWEGQVSGAITTGTN